MAESARRFFKLHGLPAPSETETRTMFPTDNIAPDVSVRTVLDMQPLLSDLRMKLLIAPKDHEFITSDHPTVTTNQRFYGRTNFPSTSGLAMRGIQVFLPLSPTACLIQYDPQCYRVGTRRQDTVSISSMDVETLNGLQVLNCDCVVYFRSEHSEPMVARICREFVSQRRDRVKATEQFGTPTGGMLFMMAKDDIRIPAQWSFCKAPKNAPTAFAPRDSEVVGLYHQWGEEQQQKKDGRIPFSEWLQRRQQPVN